MDRLFSVKTAAEYYSYSQGYFRKLINEKEIEVLHLGKSVRIEKSVLDEHFNKLMKKYNAKYSA